MKISILLISYVKNSYAKASRVTIIGISRNRTPTDLYHLITLTQDCQTVIGDNSRQPLVTKGRSKRGDINRTFRVRAQQSENKQTQPPLSRSCWHF